MVSSSGSALFAGIVASVATARSMSGLTALLAEMEAALDGGQIELHPGRRPPLSIQWRSAPTIEQADRLFALNLATLSALENIALLTTAERDATHLQAVLDSISDCYYALDRGWVLVEFSRSSELYFNLRREDVLGRSIWDVFPGGRGKAYEDVCRAAMDRGERGRLEAPSAFRPGNVVEMRTAPMPDGISVAITDITERRRAESAARRQTRELQAVLDAAPAAIWIARDTEGHDITGNRFASRLLRLEDNGDNQSKSGPDAGARVGHFRILAPDGSEVLPQNLPVQRAARGEDVTAFEERIVFDDGTEHHLFGNAVALTDGSGKPRGAVAAFVDITHLKQVERDLTALTRTLEQRIAAAVTEREAALSQLHEAQKTEALGQIAGGVAHDFNNLLSPILGGLDIIKRRGAVDARIERIVDGAIESADRARILVQRMLAFARRQPLERSAVDVPALVDNLHTLLAASVGSRVRVNADLQRAMPAALADANQLELALLNLALNARDAMPDGGVLTISAAGEADGETVRIAVTDTGIGMDAATLKRAVEPFFSTKGVGKGTGLGLSMVHGLAAQLGGRLDISSLPGLGTTVTLLLPAAPHQPLAASSATDAIAQPAAGRILLVDDEPIVRGSTRDMLEDLGYAVTEASSAQEALGLIDARGQPDWLVTDHMMPGMTGADLARAVRQSHPAVKVLIISGYADVDDLAPDLPRLAKPFRQAELAQRLVAS